MSRYYNFETSFRSLKDALCDFLKKSGFYYELSGLPGAWHFEIKLSPEEVPMVNAWIEENSIIEKQVKEE